MFDKLVESSSTGADLRPLRRIFAASFFFVAVLFTTAVIASIYAAEFDLGNDNFDLAQLLTPIAETEPPLEPEPVTQTQRSDPAQSNVTTRQSNMARVDEPNVAPTGVSVERNQYLSRPPGVFILSDGPERTAASPYDGDRPTNVGAPSRSRLVLEDPDGMETKTPPPAPVRERPQPIKSGGVLTGEATSLPQPTYSAAARAVGAQGVVTVQITVDESGKVISAKAVGGNAMLRPAAEAAAWKARFNPTKLSGIPVKVTGIISYNFKR